MKKFYLLFVVLVTAVASFAQGGEIMGKVTDETGEGAIGAVVVLVDETGKITGQGVQVDYEGNYSIKPLTAGKYNLKYTLFGYTSIVKTGISVSAGNPTLMNIKLSPSQTSLDEVIIEVARKPLIDRTGASIKTTVDKEDIGKLGTRNITDVAATSAGVVQSDAGKGLSIYGAREDATEYYIDGVKVSGTPVIPQNAVQSLTVLAGGIPVEFGDATGGIVNITTSGPADKISGGAEVLTSQFLDGFGYNLVNANLTGPIVKSKKDKTTILGFFAAFEYLSQKDRSPSAVGTWKVDPSKLDSLRQYPLIKNEVGGGFNLAAENLTMKDMYKIKIKPNNDETNFRGVARIDIKPHKTINMSVGGTYLYQKYHDWVDRYTMLNYENNPLYTENNWRVYGRFNQNFVTQDPKDGEQKKVKILRYIGYSLQFDYEKYVKKFEDESHGFNPFNYGYIGKFDLQKAPVFRSTADTFQIQDGDALRTFSNMIIQQDFIDTAVAFTPGTINPYGTRYTEQFFELGGVATDLNAIQSNKALINGQRSDLAYNLWFNTGRQYNGYGYDNYDEQYRGRAEVTMDLMPRNGKSDLNRHSLKFGVELEQRVQRRYQFSPLEIWFLSRQLMNRHLQGLDFTNPIFVLNDYPGQQYTFQQLKDLGIDPYDLDTILFKRAVNDSLQSNFDKNVRAKLGAPIDSFINVDALDPSFFSVDMFNAEEMLNNNSSYAFYRGFDYKGNLLTTRPKFFDFFTKTDANGVPTREIDAFRPFYASGYISDRFNFNDISFNVGVRVDRYDANQYVLRDPYSLYSIKTISQTGSQFAHPTNLDADNTYVYLKNSDDPSSGVAGYRSGTKWYDAYGNELATGAQVANASATGTITPYLSELDNIKDINEIRGLIKDTKRFNPEGTFTKYKPQWVVMPRLQFSFAIADKALFFAHYDVLSQRPQGTRSFMNPTDWLYFNENISTPINNPNLKPERTIDFELGFQQAIGSDKAGQFGATVSIAAYYREFRDQVQLKYYTYAFPKNYITYDNIDFGTVKGFKLDFQMRRIKNFKATANYTMQFAEGTGSDDQAQQSLALGGYDNLRTISPLGFDSRHIINVLLDYSFASGRDYDGPTSKTGYQILANTGINFNIRARSGTPYTSQSNVTPEALNATPKRLSQGSINGSRLPWNFRIDMRVYKGFDITVNKNKDKELQRVLNLQIYLQIQNLLGALNPVNVYRYTGNPDDDGYLSSSLSQASKDAAFNPQSYVDLYRAFVNDPNNYSLPRRISLGFQFNF